MNFKELSQWIDDHFEKGPLGCLLKAVVSVGGSLLAIAIIALLDSGLIFLVPIAMLYFRIHFAREGLYEDAEELPRLGLAALGISAVTVLFMVGMRSFTNDMAGTVAELTGKDLFAGLTWFQERPGKFLRWGSCLVMAGLIVETGYLTLHYTLEKNNSYLGDRFEHTLEQLARRRLLSRAYWFVTITMALLWGGFLVWGISPWRAGWDDYLSGLVWSTLAVFVLLPPFLWVVRHPLSKLWFPFLLCPNCLEEIPLVHEWGCVTGCPPKRRHVLTACPDCGEKWRGIQCPYCDKIFATNKVYNELETTFRAAKYVATPNPYHREALAATVILLASAAVGLAKQRFDMFYFFIFFAVLSIVAARILKPKRSTFNEYYDSERRDNRKF